MKRDNAFTGLEAAIVLIAFVVVAAVFSYVMLGAGFFATQKAQEVTYASIKQATSNVVFEGMMYGNVTVGGTTDGDNEDKPVLNGFMFTVKVPGGGTAIDILQTDFTYTSTQTTPPLPLLESSGPNPSKAVIKEINVGSGTTFEYPDDCTEAVSPCYYVYTKGQEQILTAGNIAVYTVTLEYLVDGVTGNPVPRLGSDNWFTIEMIPQVGAPTLVTKKLDSGLQTGKPLL
jgi:flagellin-like protein